MNRKTALVSLGMAAAIATATVAAAVAGPAVAASGTKAVTQHFDAKSLSSPLRPSKTSFVLTDNDAADGKTIGRDVLYCTGAGTGASHCRVAFAQKGGLLYAKFALSDTTGALKGTVTGGTGRFAHAKGTLAGQAVSQEDVKITLHYKK
jgi:hypothetical protein